MKTGANVVLALVVATLAACGGSVVGVQGPGVDSGAPDSKGPGTVLGDCAADQSCPTGSTCYYPIGNCDAKPQCVVNPAPGTPECGAEELLCGCGVQATSGCGFPEGFASAPAIQGSESCFPGGPFDAGPVPDATFPFDAGGPPDASFPPPFDAGPGGLCESDNDCGPDYGCFYLIGQCPSKGECIALPTGPGCGVVEELCGCDGVTEVTTGCGFPSGYASGPTGGESFCQTGPKDAGLPFDANPPSDAGNYGDASDACANLQACCSTLPSSQTSLCQTVVGSGHETACAAALQDIVAAGYCTGW